MAGSAAKGDPRAAAERIERGIERYAEGQLAASAIEFEEALVLCPGHERARQYLDWVRDVIEGRRGVNGKRRPTIDEDALRAVTEALDLDEASEGSRAPSVDEAGWEPAPITPSRAQGVIQPRPAAIPATATPHERLPSAPVYETQPITAPPQAHPTQTLLASPAHAPTPTPHAPTPTPRAPTPRAPTPHAPTPRAPTPTPPPTQKMISSPTILGVSPGLLAPITRDKVTEDRPDSVTREWGRGPTTGQNLPPLDVPELTEEQIAELISLETAPPEGDASRTPRSEIAPTPEAPRRFMEFVAEPTPAPRAMPPGVVELSSVRRLETQSITARKRDDDDHLVLPPLGGEIDPLELEPTRGRVTLPSSPPPPAIPFAELTPPPPLPGAPLPGLISIEPADDEPRDDDPGSVRTNPFGPSKLREYSHDIHAADDEPDLPRAPDPPSAESIAERFEAARRALGESEIQLALETVESVVVESGGVDAEACRPYLAILEKVYEHVVGPLDRVPTHGEGRPDLDPRAAFLLSRVDGQMTAEDLIDVSGMGRLEALRLLALLLQYGAVVID